uniref:Uncharacterized protein n=1 Tax=Anguilla anguilla TaxID=7936 RepID=A0A0E9SH41_ANGAN
MYVRVYLIVSTMSSFFLIFNVFCSHGIRPIQVGQCNLYAAVWHLHY